MQAKGTISWPRYHLEWQLVSSLQHRAREYICNVYIVHYQTELRCVALFFPWTKYFWLRFQWSLFHWSGHLGSMEKSKSESPSFVISCGKTSIHLVKRSPRFIAFQQLVTKMIPVISWGPRWAPCWPHEPCYQGCPWCLGARITMTMGVKGLLWFDLMAFHSE